MRASAASAICRHVRREVARAPERALPAAAAAPPPSTLAAPAADPRASVDLESAGAAAEHTGATKSSPAVVAVMAAVVVVLIVGEPTRLLDRPTRRLWRGGGSRLGESWRVLPLNLSLVYSLGEVQ